MHTDTWTCEYCGIAYNNPQGYEHCRCEGMTQFRAERSGKPDSLEHERAAQEARDRGMAFLVDGKHVPADRVFILSVPDTVGPISEMRQAKDHARAALQELNLARDTEMLPALAPVLSLLEEVYKALGSPYGLVRSETRRLVRQFLDALPKKTTPPSDTPSGMSVSDATRTYINGILVTDPELAAPITDAAPSITHVCADCGKPFEATGDGSIFCPLHAQS